VKAGGAGLTAESFEVEAEPPSPSNGALLAARFVGLDPSAPREQTSEATFTLTTMQATKACAGGSHDDFEVL
jgi:hypothetical protein